MAIRLIGTLDNVRHVFVHPKYADVVREEMRLRGIDQHAEMHVDPLCEHGITYWLPETPCAPCHWPLAGAWQN